MSASAPVVPASQPAPVRSGFLDTLIGIFTSPHETFRALMPSPRFWVPLLGLVALNIAFTAVWMTKVDPTEFMRHQMEESKVSERMSPEERAQTIEMQAKFFPVMAAASPVFAAIAFLGMAALFLFVYRFFYGTDLTYRQSLAVVAWSFFAVSLVTTPLMVLIMALKGDWNLDPRTVIQASAGAFLDKDTTPKPLHTLADSLDLISFWVMWILSAGYAAATRRTVGSAAAGVVGLWVVYVLFRVAGSAVF